MGWWPREVSAWIVSSFLLISLDALASTNPGGANP
jgi:hypothetical protein